MTPEVAEWLRQGGLFATTVFGLVWATLERRDRMKERDANSKALEAAQDLAVQAATTTTKIEGTLARFVDSLEQMHHRIEELLP
jgi:hypothetical protein